MAIASVAKKVAKSETAKDIGKKALKKGTPLAKDAVSALKNNKEEIKDVHQKLEEAGAYEKGVEKILQRFENGEGNKNLLNKAIQRQNQEEDERQQSLEELEDAITTVEGSLEKAGEIAGLIGNVVQSANSEIEGNKQLIEEFEETGDAELLERAVVEQLDEIEAIHEGVELAQEEINVLELAAKDIEGIEEDERLEEREVQEQQKIFREEENNQIFMQTEKGKKFLQSEEREENQEEQELNQEEQQTQQLIQMEEQEVEQLEEELKALRQETAQSEKELEELEQAYQQFPVEQDSEIQKRLEKAEQLVQEDMEAINQALKEVNDVLENEVEKTEMGYKDLDTSGPDLSSQ